MTNLKPTSDALLAASRAVYDALMRPNMNEAEDHPLVAAHHAVCDAIDAARIALYKTTPWRVALCELDEDRWPIMGRSKEGWAACNPLTLEEAATSVATWMFDRNCGRYDPAEETCETTEAVLALPEPLAAAAIDAYQSGNHDT